HWWAAHGAIGVNFHNTQWVVNDVITPDASGQLTINPKGYGFKAFELGSHGRAQPVTLVNFDKLNLTAYAVGERGRIVGTIINKEYGPDAREANVTAVAPGNPQRAEVIYLTAPGADVTTKNGVTLGGAAITNNGPWLGKWTALQANADRRWVVKVSSASAAIV